MEHPQTTKGPVRPDDEARAGHNFEKSTLVVGLTGGPATGKSTVAAVFRELGAEVISADEIVHKLLAHDEDVRRSVVKEFGKEILDDCGNVNRRRLGEIVFQDEKKRRRLERIIHPPVLKTIEQEINKFRRDGQGVLVVEIPLLVEVSCFYLVDKVVVVTAEQETQLQRLQNRYGLSQSDAMKRINAQLPLSAKLKYADWVIDNNGTVDATREQVQKVWQAMRDYLAQPG